MVRLKKGLASLYWEDLVLAIIGEQFDVGDEICGAVVSVRGGEDIISVWNKTAEDKEATDKIRDKMREVLNLPSFVPMEYKKHHDSLHDKSSFRNTQVWRAPKGEGGKGRNRPDNRDRDNRRGMGMEKEGGGARSSWDSTRGPKSGSTVDGGTEGSSLPTGSSWGNSHREGATTNAWSRGRGVGIEEKRSSVGNMRDGINRPSAPTNAWGKTSEGPSSS